MADADVVKSFYSYDVFIIYGVVRSMIFCSDKDAVEKILCWVHQITEFAFES